MYSTRNPITVVLRNIIFTRTKRLASTSSGSSSSIKTKNQSSFDDVDSITDTRKHENQSKLNVCYVILYIKYYIVYIWK